MTYQEFIDKYNLKFLNKKDAILFFSMLDDFYLHFTKEQVLEIIGDFYDNADDIFNDLRESLIDKK